VRFRVGDYRAIVVVDHARKRIEIVRIGHRSDVYR
jgi:mRNA-degrading endonuclease RelE of RelBE toxin-antitoxin system